MPEPRWATRRRPERRTYGHRLAAIAEQLHRPLMPWQQYVANVGCELLEDGRPAYRKVIISVPRQCGKTTLILCWELDRALSFDEPQRIIYSAQTGRDAREKLLEDQVPMLERSNFKHAIRKVVRVNGGESVLFKNDSRLSIVASSESAGHGKTIGLGVVDEAFDDVDNRREQALSPAMRTVANAQMLVASTMGTDASIYLNQMVEVGRLAATEDREDSRIAYFEWSAPDGCDIADPRVWAACTPAWGFTVFEDTIRSEYESNLATPGEFARFALNQRTASDERVIPLEVWEKVLDPDCRPDGLMQFAVDCNPERSAASIAVSDASRNIEVVDHRDGTDWIVGRAVELSQRWNASFLVDPAAGAGAFIGPLQQAGVPVVPCGGQDFTKACGQFYDAVFAGEVRVRPHPSLDAAMAAAKKRAVSDAWVWARKSSVDISPLVAVTLAAANAGGGKVELIAL